MLPSKTNGPTSEINITPMTDVLLVLLVVFIVIQPSLQKGIDVQVPPEPDQEQAAFEIAEPRDQIILYVEPGVSYSINKEPVLYDDLATRIHEIFDARPRKVLFVKGSEDVLYSDVIHAIDVARSAGIVVIGLVPRGPSDTPLS